MKRSRAVAYLFGVLIIVAYVTVAWIYASGAMSSLVKRSEIPTIGGVVAEPVTFLNDDIELVGSFYANPVGAPCGVVMVHGVDDDRSSVLRFAPLYWDLGCSLLAFDHRGHGQSSPAPRTYGFNEAADTELAVEWLMERADLTPSQVGLHGNSLGAATSLEVLDRRDDLAFIVGDSPYSSMAAIVSDKAGDTLGIAEPVVRPLAFLFIQLRADMEVGKVDATDTVRRKETPILLMHTLGDEDVPTEHSERIAIANLSIERHVLEADGVHLNAYELRTAVYTEIVHEFLEQNASQFLP